MKKNKPYVVYWNNIPSPYMVERFNALADNGIFEFEAWFNDRLEPGRSWDVDETTWRFKYRYLPVTKIAGRTLHWPFLLFWKRPDVLVSLYAEPSFIMGWTMAKLLGSRTAFWVEFTDDSWPWIRRRKWKDFIKRWMFPRVDAVVTVGGDGARFARRYGCLEHRITYAPHVIDMRYFMHESDKAKLSRDELRNKHQLQGITFIYVGRLWSAKGLNYLIDAFANIQSHSDVEVSLLLVGDGPEEDILKQQCAVSGIRNVVFAGFMQKNKLPMLYAMADVFVFPTLGDTYGLVVDEAMACSLPIISTSAAGEIRDRIEEGSNGYIVPPKDSDALATSMLQLIRNAELRSKMGARSFEKIEGRTPESWAQDFERIVDKLLGGSL